MSAKQTYAQPAHLLKMLDASDMEVPASALPSHTQAHACNKSHQCGNIE
jgi:hypothetical protein